MNSLRITVGGVRGIVGESLTPDLIVRYSHALGTYLDRVRVLVSRDTRQSGPMVASCAVSGLIAAGCEVIDLGICPTAALQLAVQNSFAGGGLAITAGHNPRQWNALKPVRGDGNFLNPTQSNEVLDIYHQAEFAKARWDELHPVAEDDQAGQRHLDAIYRELDTDDIRRDGLHVAIDCVNGACSEYAPGLLEMLQVRHVAMNTETHLPFPHDPEPASQNLTQLQALVKATGADIGFGFDADGDRIGVVCHDGTTPGDEAALCLAEEMILRRGDPGPVVTNLSTTQAVDEIARKYGRTVVRTPVGQAYIAEAASNYQAAVAGEGSGGCVFPRLNYAHDSIAAMGHLLQLVCQSGQTLKELVEQLPEFYMQKRVVPCPVAEAYSVLEKIREQPVPDWVQERDDRDGMKLSGNDRWVHVRVSITEPIIRVITEATDEATARQLAEQYVHQVRQRM
ncbi:MAG: phosphoglucosamine mutase [Armatimonadota bacterium]